MMLKMWYLLFSIPLRWVYSTQIHEKCIGVGFECVGESYRTLSPLNVYLLLLESI